MAIRLLTASTWPDPLGPFHRTQDQPLTPTADQALWDEYGLKEAEQAHYENGAQECTMTAYRFQDSTGAMAAFEWLSPPDSKPSPLAKLAAETSTGILLVHGNYILRFDGFHPDTALLTTIIQSLTQVDNSTLPDLMEHLPTQDLIPNSRRYITGPVGLQKFDPGIPPSTAAFHLSAEAQLGSYQTPGGEMKLAIFDYPTPPMARQQAAEFQKLPSAMVKRSGPLVAVILSPPSPDAAERLLSLIRFQADVTLDERVSTRRDNIGDLVINAFVLTGILLAFCLATGLAFGIFRAFLHRGKAGEEADALTVLHLGDR